MAAAEGHPDDQIVPLPFRQFQLPGAVVEGEEADLQLLRCHREATKDLLSRTLSVTCWPW